MANDLVETTNLPVSSDDAPAASVPAAVDRRAEIERVRSTDIERYYRDGMDRELLEFLKDDFGERSPTDVMAPDQSRRELIQSEAGRKLVQEWSRWGNFSSQLRAVQDQAGKLVRGLGGEREQRAFIEKFDRQLPENLRYGIYQVIASGGLGFVRPADKQGVEHFSKDSVGAALVKEWGSAAPEKIGRIWSRIDFLKLVCGDLSAGFEWFNSLNDREARSILEHLAR